ncbi:Trp biosynthesis-associated membrane protein, partial [Microbispora sp. ATCC PTA-5024]|uniref:Trp biosynthesis-associated membrane protein n=1 Tax=Microbispora sp. ATCC PTA-5024 TaxID=316330 RepID=UPI0003DD7454
RSLLVWLAACAAGGGLALLAAGRTWAAVTFSAQAGPLSAGRVSLSGGELVASLTPSVLAALAAAVAVLATRGIARRVIGAVISLCGLAAAAGAWSGTRAETIVGTAREHASTAMVPSGGAVAHSVTWAWPLAAATGGLVLVAAGVVAAVAGGRWPGMSSRYDRPAGGGPARAPGRERAPRSERAMWDALDEGADPTIEPPRDRSS